MCQKIAIVLAAGKGTRMKSDLPKVLAKVHGRPMIEYVLDALEQGGIDRTIVVIGYQAEKVRQALSHRSSLEFTLQTEQLGTGHAVMTCRELLNDHTGAVFVLAGDQPLTQASSVTKLLDEFDQRATACIMGTANKENPDGLGRILRDDDGKFQGIVEEKDATEQQRRITEVNMSYYVFHWPKLASVLDKIRDENSQGEYYLTDAPGLLLADGKEVRALPVLQPCESLSINTLEELSAVEQAMTEHGV